MNKLAILTALLVLTGCATTRTITVPVNVPVPVKCQAAEPSRPVMPTDLVSPTLKDDALVFEYSRAAAAEIKLREGYEIKLLAAFRSCK